MSEMEEQLLGVPVTRDLPCVVSKAMLELASAQKAEIESAGLTVVRIHIVEPEQPIRFFIKFGDGQQSYVARGKLEALNYDVGQKIRENSLLFYAVKRITMTKGWSD